jgi:alpha-galactosidase
MQPVVDKVHSLGLKFGLYTSASPLTCAGFAASCMHEAVDVEEWVRYLE